MLKKKKQKNGIWKSNNIFNKEIQEVRDKFSLYPYNYK